MSTAETVPSRLSKLSMPETTLPAQAKMLARMASLEETVRAQQATLATLMATVQAQRQTLDALEALGEFVRTHPQVQRGLMSWLRQYSKPVLYWVAERYGLGLDRNDESERQQLFAQGLTR